MNQLFFIFVMLINSSIEVTIQKGEPVFFQINISSADSLDVTFKEAALYRLDVKLNNGKINREEYQHQVDQLENIRQGKYTIRGKDSLWSESLGFQVYSEDKKFWVPFPGEVMFFNAYPGDKSISIQPEDEFMAEFGISPEVTLKLESALYRIRATAKVYTEGKSGLDTAFSSEASLVVQDKQVDMENTSTLARFTEYYIKTGNFGKALEYAQKYQDLMRDRPEGYTLLARVYEGMKDYQKALELYLKANDKLTPDHDPDYGEYLYDQITRMLNMKPD